MDIENIKILIVEDELLIASGIQLALKSRGAGFVEIVNNGETALSLLETFLPDVILMDIKLSGGIDGIQTTAEIQSRFDIPVIYMTAHTDEATLSKAKKTGPYGYIVKPVNENELLSTIEIALYKHKADIKLRDSEERFRQIADNIREIFWMTDPESSRVLYVSPAYEKIWDRSLDDLYKKPQEWTEPILEEDLPAVLENFKKQAQGLDTYNEFRIKLPGGAIRWIGNRAYPIKSDDEKKVLYITGIAEDISERKQIEHDKHSVETRYQQLFDNIGSGVAVYEATKKGSDFIFRDINRAGEIASKVDKDDIEGKPVTEVFPTIRELGLLDVFKRVWKTGKPELHPVSMYKDDRLTLWVENKVYKLPSGEVVAVYEDITEKTQAGIELKKAEDEKNKAYFKLDQIFNISTSGIILIDKDSIITDANNTFLKMMNQNADVVVGKKCFKIIDEKQCNTDECPLKRILNGENAIDSEMQRGGSDGENRTLKITSVPFTSPENEVIGILKTFADITEIRTLERELISISENERRSIGQNIHDEIGQLLTGVSFLVKTVKKKMSGYPDIATDEIDRISDLVRETTKHSRQLAKGLSPVNFELGGFTYALEELSQSTSDLYQISCTLENRSSLEIKDNFIATQLYHIAQESVNNAIKHGNATSIIILLISDESGLTMSIQNNGKDVAKKSKKGKGMGIGIMKHRSSLIGAEFSIETNGKEGFTVLVKMKY